LGKGERKKGGVESRLGTEQDVVGPRSEVVSLTKRAIAFEGGPTSEKKRIEAENPKVATPTALAHCGEKGVKR